VPDFIANLPFLLAAIVSFLVALIHVFIGGPEVARPLLRTTELGTVPRLTAYYCWHLVSITLIAMAVGFAIPALTGQDWMSGLLWTIIAAGFALWSLVLALLKSQPLFRFPQWALFLPVAALGGWGLI